MNTLRTAWSFVSGRWQIILAGAAAIMAAYLLGYYKGAVAERAEWQAATARLQAQITERARQADNARQTELSGTNAAITQARQELDNATRNLPDESPSARRHARICAELRDQAARNHTAAPAC